MNRTWGEIRNRVIDLGFEKASVYGKQKDAFIRACNVAQNVIAEKCPIVDKLTVTVAGVDTEYASFDVEALALADGKRFMCFDRDPTYTGDGTDYTNVTGYKIEQGHILLLPIVTGDYTVWYRRYPEQITSATNDDDFVELDARAADIIPYFVAHDLWADDDLAKATVWWNIADQRLNILSASAQSNAPEYENTTGWW